MLEIIFILSVLALITWRFLSYLDGMGRIQDRIRRDRLMQAQCKALAETYRDDKFVCPKCTDIKEIK